MRLVAPGFCQCMSTILLMTALYLYYLLCSEGLYSHLSICSLSILYTITFWLSLYLISAFFCWFSHLHLNLHARVPKFLSSVDIVVSGYHPECEYLFVCGHLVFRDCSVHVCVSGQNSNRRDSPYSSSTYRRH
jgi:hypothetical protein